ncbi:MAG: cobyrinic acid a,c-diamide synthase [Thermodesulfovibrio sp.]|nr:cobyrinic acid a,c-diamide synthase [Thermodesulfovibrio sp.]
MVHLYIASMSGFSGKSLVTLGLGLLMKERGFRIGYIKPYGNIPSRYEGKLVDADAEFMRKALDLPETPEAVSPFVVTFELQSSALKGRAADKFKVVNEAIEMITEKDVVLIGGAANLFEGSVFGLSGLRLINHLRAKTLVVEPWSGDSSIDSLIGSKELLGEHFAGAVINKIPQAAHDYVNTSVRPYLEKRSIPIFACLHRDILLDSITVRQLNEILNGKVLCCEEGLDEFIESFSVGAMDVDSALKYFRRTPNKAVITGAHRSDIQLAALETSTRCVILTGGMHTNDVILGKAKQAGVPFLSVHDDTYSTVEKIEAVLGKIRIREQKKVQKTREIMEKEFDFNRLVRTLNINSSSGKP